MARISDVDRFLSKVTKTPECWLWDAAMRSTGYGVFSFGGKAVTASRVSHILFKGEIPDGLFVCHHCDNPRCVKPEHLFLGTNRDNVEDRKSKGRIVGRKGVLTQGDIDRVLELHRLQTYSYRSISELTGVSRETVRRVVNKTYTLTLKDSNEPKSC